MNWYIVKHTQILRSLKRDDICVQLKIEDEMECRADWLMWTLDKQPWEGSLCWEGLKNSPRIFDKQTLYNSMEFMKRKSKRWIIQCTQFEKCWALDFGRNLVWWTCLWSKTRLMSKTFRKWKMCRAQKIYLFSDGVRIKVCPIYFPFLRSVKKPDLRLYFLTFSDSFSPQTRMISERIREEVLLPPVAVGSSRKRR